MPEPTACPICGRPVTAAHRPFCSARCRQVDLGRWLGETYRIPAVETDESDEPGPDEAEPAPDGPTRG
ncbi:DNA gyrase inhibitor YacG [Stella sp.]|uniref:DNA gyrase inhibitor YacG n=1 Tax=Stella sp. TaxID=2912054 RepID=UPI0035B0D114